MRFEYPHLLWSLLAIAPGLALFFYWAWKSKQRALAQLIGARLLTTLAAAVSTQRQKARMVLVFTAVVLALLALARPQFGFSWEEAKSRGLDIVVAIDTSKSMLAADVAPNRLRRAQLAALDLKRLARADRLALVAFAGSAFLQCPLTLDDEAFRQSVEALDVNIIPQGGSALSEAIAAAEGAFKKGNDNHKVLVVFTDGEDNEGSAVEAAKAAGKDGLRIFTIGVGTANGELLRITDTQGRSHFIKDENGNAVKSRLNEKLLQDVSKETGGFFMLLSGANTMNVLYERGLAPLPKSDLTSHRVKRHHERFQWLLGFVVVLLLAEMFVSERKGVSRSKGQQSMAGSGKRSAAAAVLLFALRASVHGASSSEALKAYRAGEFSAAQLAYEEMLVKTPGDARLHFNAGAAAFQGALYDIALDHFNAALTNADVNLQQQIYYNLGNTRYRLGMAIDEQNFEARLKPWGEALTNYQNAVALRTNDVDAAFNLQFVKGRIEEVHRMIRFREEARRAKAEAEAAARRRNYARALQILETSSNTNAATKEYKEYMDRLKSINEINTSRQP